MQFAKNWFQSLYSGLISGGTWGVLDQLVTNSYGAQIILCCLLLTRHEHISSQNACTILWHKHRKPLSYSDSWTWNSVHCTDMCASGGVTWNKYIILRYERRLFCMHIWSPHLALLWPSVVQATSKLPVRAGAIRLQSDCTTVFNDWVHWSVLTRN